MRSKLVATILSIVSAVALASVVEISTAEASTQTGYVCWTQYIPPLGGQYGSAGSVQFWVYSGASCSGSALTLYRACSTGATDSTVCDLTYLYPSAALTALMQNLQRAAETQQKVLVTYWSGTQFAYTQFRAD